MNATASYGLRRIHDWSFRNAANDLSPGDDARRVPSRTCLPSVGEEEDDEEEDADEDDDDDEEEDADEGGDGSRVSRV